MTPSPRFVRITFVVARIVAAGIGAVAAGAITAPSPGIVVLGVAMAGWSLGIWMLWPAALRLTTALLLLAAVIAPLGMINPFYASDAAASDLAKPDFIQRTVLVALGTSAACVALAWLISQARLARKREP